MRAGQAPDLAKTRHRSKHATSLRYSKSPTTRTRSRKFVRSCLSCLGSLFDMRPIKEPSDLGDAKSGAGSDNRARKFFHVVEEANPGDLRFCKPRVESHGRPRFLAVIIE